MRWPDLALGALQLLDGEALPDGTLADWKAGTPPIRRQVGLELFRVTSAWEKHQRPGAVERLEQGVFGNFLPLSR